MVEILVDICDNTWKVIVGTLVMSIEIVILKIFRDGGQVIHTGWVAKVTIISVERRYIEDQKNV